VPLDAFIGIVGGMVARGHKGMNARYSTELLDAQFLSQVS
jgi:hypothetical protein